MQRKSGNRSYNRILLVQNQGLNINNYEMEALIAIKTQVSTVVKTYISGGSNRDRTLAELDQISQQIKLKIATIA